MQLNNNWNERESFIKLCISVDKICSLNRVTEMLFYYQTLYKEHELIMNVGDENNDFES